MAFSLLNAEDEQQNRKAGEILDESTKQAIEDTPPDTLLVAHARVSLTNGQQIELLPFVHQEDVKSELTGLLDSWQKSGYLLKDTVVYPWHTVERVEIVKIEELAKQDPHMLEICSRVRAQDEAFQAIWRTKKDASGKDDASKSTSN